MSRKNVTDEGWEHLEILLRPNPYDSTFKDLIIDEGNANQMKIIAEFIDVIA